MIIVRVELHSAITGAVTEIGRMHIWNAGTGNNALGNYGGKTIKGRGEALTADEIREAAPLREGRVENYPRLRLSVWTLITRMLKNMEYE